MVVDFNAPPAKVVSPSKLAHVVLRTNNKEQLKEFYVKFLGARDQFSNPSISFLSYDDEHHRIAIIEIPGTADKLRQSCGLEHIAFTFNSLSELLLAYRQRKSLGMEPVWCVNHGPTISIYYKDTDGNILETQADIGSVEDANAMMESEAFAENAIGVDFDPEEYIRRLEGGESEESLMVRPRGVRTEFPSVML